MAEQPDPTFEALDPARVAVWGQSWVTSVREELKRDGRRASGMWPGTMSEARALVGRELGHAQSSLTHAARERVAHALYEDARRRWLSSRELEEVDLDEG